MICFPHACTIVDGLTLLEGNVLHDISRGCLGLLVNRGLELATHERQILVNDCSKDSEDLLTSDLSSCSHRSPCIVFSCTRQGHVIRAVWRCLKWSCHVTFLWSRRWCHHSCKDCSCGWEHTQPGNHCYQDLDSRSAMDSCNLELLVLFLSTHGDWLVASDETAHIKWESGGGRKLMRSICKWSVFVNFKGLHAINTIAVIRSLCTIYEYQYGR